MRSAAHAACEILHLRHGGSWAMSLTTESVIGVAGTYHRSAPASVWVVPTPTHMPGLRVFRPCLDPFAEETLALAQRLRPSVVQACDVVIATLEADERRAFAVDESGTAEADRNRDELTGLVNQGGWWRTVEELERRLAICDFPVVIAVVDLDGLKAVNDGKGHLHGDALIRDCAAVLAGASRDSDVVGRIGGDEFGILAVGHQGPEQLLEERLRSRLRDAGLPASLGVALHDGTSLHATFHEADQRMYRDKRVRKSASVDGDHRLVSSPPD